MNILFEKIKTIGIFLICAQALLHFRPKGVYEKYIRLLVSIMLLVQLIEPIGSLTGIFIKGELQEKIRNMDKKLSQTQEMTISVNGEIEDIWSFFMEEAGKNAEKKGE